jgi:hypothetical protein
LTGHPTSVTEPLGGDTPIDTDLVGPRMLVKTKPDFQEAMVRACWLAFDVGRWHPFEKETGVAYV